MDKFMRRAVVVPGLFGTSLKRGVIEAFDSAIQYFVFSFSW